MFLRVGKEDVKVSLKDTGTILMYAGLSFIIPIIMAILIDKSIDNLLSYSIAAFVILFTGYTLKNLINTKKETETKHAMLSIVLIWIFFCFFASLPFVMIMKVSFLDAFFETISTLTTTGLSVMIPLLDSMPKSLIFWRTFLGWIGGVGIVLMALIGLMATYSKTTKWLMAEGRGNQLKENLKTGVTKITTIYVILTIIGIILLMLSGQTLWEATNYSMSAISTNGMSITSGGLITVNNGFMPTGVHNYWVDFSLIVIMFLGAMSFSLYYLAIKRRSIKIFLKDPEFRLLLLLSLLSSLIVGTKIGIWSALFHTFSLSTCGGFAFLSAGEIGLWSDFIKAILIPLIIIGGAAGSTAGGIKLSRFIIFCKGIYWKIKEGLLPSGSFFKKNYNGQTISFKDLKEINQFILIWIIFIAIGSIILTAYGHGLVNSVFEVASAQSNAGITTGITNNLAPAGVKIILIVNMLVGRLEIIPLITSVGLLLGMKRIL